MWLFERVDFKEIEIECMRVVLDGWLPYVCLRIGPMSANGYGRVKVEDALINHHLSLTRSNMFSLPDLVTRSSYNIEVSRVCTQSQDI